MKVRQALKKTKNDKNPTTPLYQNNGANQDDELACEFEEEYVDMSGDTSLDIDMNNNPSYQASLQTNNGNSSNYAAKIENATTTYDYISASSTADTNNEG